MITSQTSPVEPTPPAPGRPAAGTLRPAAAPSPAVARGGEGAQPRVIGIDLAAGCSGIALPDGTTTVIREPKPRGKRRTLADDLDRMAHFADALEPLLYTHSPTLAVIEDYAAGIKSAAVHRLAEIGGIARWLCHHHDVQIALVNVMHLKIYATGTGKAEKRDMAVEAFDRAGLKFGTSDECDAWWLYAMGCDWSGRPVVDVPKSHRAVLTKVTWPALAAPIQEAIA